MSYIKKLWPFFWSIAKIFLAAPLCCGLRLSNLSTSDCSLDLIWFIWSYSPNTPFGGTYSGLSSSLITETINVLSWAVYVSWLTRDVPNSCQALPTNSIFAISSWDASDTPETTNLTDLISLSEISWIFSKSLNGTLINLQPVLSPFTSVDPAT